MGGVRRGPLSPSESSVGQEGRLESSFSSRFGSTPVGLKTLTRSYRDENPQYTDRDLVGNNGSLRD